MGPTPICGSRSRSFQRLRSMPSITEQGEAEPDTDSSVRTPVPHSFHSTMVAVEHRKFRARFPSWVPRGSLTLYPQWKQLVSPPRPTARRSLRPSGLETSCMQLGRGWEDSLHPWKGRELSSPQAVMGSWGFTNTRQSRGATPKPPAPLSSAQLNT